MGTNNFYYRNASKVYSICESDEQPVIDEDGNETEEMETYTPDEFDCNEQLNFIKQQLEENKGKFNFCDRERKSEFDNRNFPSTYIGTLWIEKYYGDICVELEINCFARAGYYDAACLDWEIEFKFDGGCTCDDTDSVNELFVYGVNSYTMNKGMLVIQGRNCDIWADRTKDELVSIVEKVFENCSTTYNKVATFSNGETIYEKC